MTRRCCARVCCPGLLKAVTTNLRAGAKAVRLFEIGRVFSAMPPEETTHLALLLSGPVSERTWRTGEGSEADLFDLKGMIVSVLGGEVAFEIESNPALALSLAI